MNSLITRLAAIHQALWSVDRRYQLAWYIWPNAASLAAVCWLLSVPATDGGAKAGSAAWGKPASSAPSGSKAPSDTNKNNQPAPTSADQSTCLNDDLAPQVRIEACTRAAGESSVAAATKAEFFFKRGYARSQLTGQEQLSLDDYAEALKLNTNHYWALNNRGAILLNQSKPKDAIAELDKAIAIEPRGAYALTNRGMAHLMLSNFDKAIADASAAVVADPDYLRSSLIRGRAYREKGENAAALRDLDAYLAKFPSDFEALKARAAARVSLQRFDDSIADANVALRLNPNDAELLSFRCAASYGKKDYQQAEQDCNEALKINPKLWYANEIRGRTYFARNRYQDAVQELSKIPNIQSRPLALEDRGRAFLALGKLPAAATDFVMLTNADPKNATAFNLLGVVSVRMTDEQQKVCNEPVDPAKSQFFGQRPLSCSAPPDFSEALQAYTKAVELDATYSVALINRGWIYNRVGNYQAALADTTRGLQMNRNTQDGHSCRGTALLKLNNPTEAINTFTTLIGLAPNLAFGYHQRALAYLATGNKQGAIADLRSCLQVDSSNQACRQQLGALGQR